MARENVTSHQVHRSSAQSIAVLLETSSMWFKSTQWSWQKRYNDTITTVNY